VRKPEGQRTFEVLPRRWVVERTLSWITKCRRLDHDYERLTKTSVANGQMGDGGRDDTTTRAHTRTTTLDNPIDPSQTRSYRRTTWTSTPGATNSAILRRWIDRRHQLGAERVIVGDALGDRLHAGRLADRQLLRPPAAAPPSRAGGGITKRALTPETNPI